MQSRSRGIAAIAGLAIFLVGALLGVYAGYTVRPEVSKVTELIGTNKPDITAQADFESFWKVWNLLNEKFVKDATSTEKFSPQNKVYGAIDGLVRAYGDPYTVFLPPQEKAIFESDIKGNFEGVGMEVGIDDGVITIITPLKGSPAEKAGILPGDKLLQIDGKPTQDMSIDEAVLLIRGQKGTQVKLTIYREGDGETREISVERDVITIPTLVSEIKEANGKKVFLISLYNFSAPSAELFRAALAEFTKSGTDKLIIDLRGNPGGYLEASVDMASWFLPTGKVVVREYYGPNQPEEIVRSKGYPGVTPSGVVVLINRGSASASEILAGALSEHDVATLVGERSFGKGSVQELVNVTKDTAIKITIARWLTPNGVSISANGLTPDVEVIRTEEEILAGVDSQMNKALEILTK